MKRRGTDFAPVENTPVDIAARLAGMGITPMNGMSETLTAASVAVQLGRGHGVA